MMNKKINLSVSSFLLAGFLITGCTQQQVNAASGGLVAGSVVGGHDNPVKDGYGGIVTSTYAAASTTAIGPDVQTAPLVRPHGIDAQVQNIVVPEPSFTPKVYQPKPIPRVIQRPRVKPAPMRPRMVKPIQRMAKPVQRRMVKPVQRRSSVAYTGQRSAMPPAKPNQCYAKVRTAPTFRNAVKRVQVSPAVNKRVLVRGPQYTYASKRVQVRPATHAFRYVPAQYRNVSKRVLVKPAHYTWQKGKKGPVTRIDNMTGEILCRVKIPAQYRTVVQKVLVRPAQRIKRNIPAVYRTVKQKRLASPAQYRNVRQPARFVNKTYRVQTRGAGYKWQPIGC